MISNPVIPEKIDELTQDNPVMREFLLNIISHENEKVQYIKQYDGLIEKAVKRQNGAGK